jgi:polyphenol oxidase
MPAPTNHATNHATNHPTKHSSKHRQVARWRFSDSSSGGVEIPASDPTVTWLTQTHQAGVVVVRTPGEHRGVRADAAVTDVVGPLLLIRTADCAPVLLIGEADGQAMCVGVAHAGWRGLISGILPAAVGALRGLGATTVRASLFASIGAQCYEFGEAELDAASVVLGDSVRAVTLHGTPALDMVAGVRASLASCGVDELDTSRWACTACDPYRYFSFRARGDSQRMGLYAWLASESTENSL